MNPFEQHLQDVLSERRSKHRYRQRKVTISAVEPEVIVNENTYISFCSNDYLGLANHPEVVSALTESATQFGVGSGASHLVSGHSSAHHKLECDTAAYCGRERALLFSSGYMANLGAIASLVGVGDAIFQDRLNHASLLDAGRLSGARFSRFQHNNMDDLEKKLKESSARRKLIVVDGVFSMDGDLAPLPKLSALAKKYNAWLMVDDAHGFGCLGNTGFGSCEHWGLSQDQVPVLMGTLGKAMGTFGAFVAGSDQLIEGLIQLARTYIYTTAMPPAVAAATSVSLALSKKDNWRREHLVALIQQFREGASVLGYSLMPSETPIQPILVGGDTAALTLSHALEQQGYLISAIRPPTVPDGSARLRVTLSAAHTQEHVAGLLTALKEVKESGQGL